MTRGREPSAAEDPWTVRQGMNRLDLTSLCCQSESTGCDMEKSRGPAKVQPQFDAVVGGLVDGNAVMRAQWRACRWTMLSTSEVSFGALLGHNMTGACEGQHRPRRHSQTVLCCGFLGRWAMLVTAGSDCPELGGVQGARKNCRGGG